MKKKTLLTFEEYIERELNKGWYLPYVLTAIVVALFIIRVTLF